MEKLLKLKNWLTIEDTAKHLSKVFEEDVSEADVLRLALDGQLQLSANFVNHTIARRSKIIPLSEAETIPGIPVIKDGQPCEPYEVVLGTKIISKNPDGQIEEKVLQLDDKITEIYGIWNLAMIGGELLDIEHKYQKLTNGVEVTLETLEGTFVKKSEGELWSLQTSFDDNEHTQGSLAQLEELKNFINNSNIDRYDANKLLDQHKEDRKQFLKERKTKPEVENYYPAGGLPKDCVLVVRTEALKKLEQKINETTKDTEKTLSTTERNTLLAIIGVMAKKGYRHTLKKPYEDAREIQRNAEELGIKISDDTIASKLKEAKKILDDKTE